MEQHLEVKTEPFDAADGLSHPILEVKTEPVSPEADRRRNRPLTPSVSNKEVVEIREELVKMREAYDRSTREVGYLRKSVESITEKQNSKLITYSRIRILQTQMEKALQMIGSMGGDVKPILAENTLQNQEDDIRFDAPVEFVRTPLPPSAPRDSPSCRARSKAERIARYKKKKQNMTPNLVCYHTFRFDAPVDFMNLPQSALAPLYRHSQPNLEAVKCHTFHFEPPVEIAQSTASLLLARTNLPSQATEDFGAVSGESHLEMNPNQLPMTSTSSQQAPHNKTESCIFCGHHKHTSFGCFQYRYTAEKIAVAENRSLCLKCLEPIYDPSLRCHVECPSSTKKCQRCSSDTHQSLFCSERKLNYKRKCDFCDKSHDSKRCPKYFSSTTSAFQRKQRMRKENRCLQCLKRIGRKQKHLHCRNNGHVCQLCVHLKFEKEPHHPLLCEYFYDYQQEDVSKKA